MQTTQLIQEISAFLSTPMSEQQDVSDEDLERELNVYAESSNSASGVYSKEQAAGAVVSPTRAGAGGRTALVSSTSRTSLTSPARPLAVPSSSSTPSVSSASRANPPHLDTPADMQPMGFDLDIDLDGLSLEDLESARNLGILFLCLFILLLF